MFSQIIADIAKLAFPKDVEFCQMDIKGDVEKLKNLMTETVRGFPFDSSQEFGMNVNFKTELTSFILRYPTPIIKLSTANKNGGRRVKEPSANKNEGRSVGGQRIV